MESREKTGITVAGTVIVDKINEISAYPRSGELTQIRNIQTAIGGCVPNVALDLKRIDPSLEVHAVGTIGDDKEGTFVTETLKKGGVGTDGLTVLPGEKTSFTDVMSVPGGQRTFFTYAGASAKFGSEHMPFEKVKPKMLHLGYFLLLERVDNGEGLKILQMAKELGIETSIDLVSENSDRYALVKPCLPYTDYLIINELEAGKLTGVEPCIGNLEKMALRLKEMGVRKKVIIHMPECAFCAGEEGCACLPSYQLPVGEQMPLLVQGQYSRGPVQTVELSETKIIFVNGRMTLENGMLTAVSEGEEIIRVTAEGRTKEIKVLVTEN